MKEHIPNEIKMKQRVPEFNIWQAPETFVLLTKKCNQ